MIAPALVFLIRLLVPLSILRWPFWGMLLSIAADAADVVLFSALGWGILEGRGMYHELDKVFDIYYLALAAYVAFKWRDALPRRLALALFAWRLVGEVVFELTHARQVLFFSPNIFENFYLLWAGTLHFFPGVRMTKKRLFFFFVFLRLLRRCR